jgi:hypothetical protein
MGNPFEIEPVPRNINALCKAVKAGGRNTLRDIDAFMLAVYNLKNQVADEEIEIPADGKTPTTATLSANNKVPKRTTARKPLVVVAPAMTTSTTASQAARTTAALDEAR